MSESPPLTDTYLTIDKPGDGLYKEKGSKFFGYAVHVTSEEEIKAELDSRRGAL